MAERKAGEEAVMRLYSGLVVDLNNFSARDVNIRDIARSLSYLCRFNGHVKEVFTVAEHSIIGSRMATSPKFAMEFLLHDTGESFTGDIITPVKQLFPEIGKFEDRLTAVIFDVLWSGSGLTTGGVYKKSPYIALLDRQQAEWEDLFLRPTHVFKAAVWESRGPWKAAQIKLSSDMRYTPLEDIFISEYLELKDALS